MATSLDVASDRVSTSTRRAAQREATRARLFEASVDEFKRTGFAHAEIAVIADRVGVSRGAFYVHFSGKDAVLRELLVTEERRIADEVGPLIEQGAALDVILNGVGDSVLKAERRLGRRLIRDLCAAQFRPEFVAGQGVGDHPVAQAVVRAVADRVDHVDATDFATVFLTGLFGLLATAEGPQSQRRRLIRQLVELLTQGVVAP